MQKILKFRDHYDIDYYYDISTPEKRRKAYLAIFEMLDSEDNSRFGYADEEGLEEDAKKLEELLELQKSFDSLPELMKPDARRKLEEISYLRRNIGSVKSTLYHLKKAREGKAQSAYELIRDIGGSEECDVEDFSDEEETEGEKSE